MSDARSLNQYLATESGRMELPSCLWLTDTLLTDIFSETPPQFREVSGIHYERENAQVWEHGTSYIRKGPRK